MARTAALVAPAKRFVVNGRLATGNGDFTVEWELELTGEEIANMLRSGAYLGFVCTTCNDEAAYCPELRQFVPTDMVVAACTVADEPVQLESERPAELDSPATVHGHDRHGCPVCGNAMWSPGFSIDDTVSCGACSYRTKRQPGKDYAPCQGSACRSRVPA